MTDFDKLYADEFQCPYCTESYKFSRNRNKATQEQVFRTLRHEMVRQHIEKYHPDKMAEFLELRF